MKVTDNTGITRNLLKIAQCAGFAASLFGASMLISSAAQAELRSGFNTNTLAANDDGSTGLVDLGFTLNFFGTGFNQTYVNNNGNITFDGPMGTYTPFTITNNSSKIIAPFFADVDTAIAGSNPVTYGTGTVGTQQAFGVNWINVACFATPDGGYNTFQLVLIDRSDIGAGDFDIEFNYGQIVWEAGTASGGNSVCQGGTPAHIGYSSGSGQAGGSFELAGSGIAGYFLDKLADGVTDNPTGLIYNNRNSLQPGRYVFEVRNGNAPLGYGISGTIYGNDNTNPLASSLVQVCNIPDASNPDTHCSLTTSNVNGEYNIGGISDGNYSVKAFAPEGTQYQAASINVTFSGANLTGQDIILVGPQPLPGGTTILPVNGNTNGTPVVYWNNPLTLTTHGCTGGAASYTITSDDNGAVIASGSMTENPAGSGNYSVVIPAFYPQHGWVTVDITLNCGGNISHVVFSMYIDPSGVVKDTHGNPVNGATVTLYRSLETVDGPWEVVPDGSAIMDVSNRVNPYTTGASGRFGWDVVAGFYKVRAEKQGCTAPSSTQSYVETNPLTIPPPVTDIQLILDCGTPVYAVCDVNQDGSISRTDISIISSRLRQTVPVGTQGDVNRDGKITTLDTRGCTLQCTLPSCAEPQSGS